MEKFAEAEFRLSRPLSIRRTLGGLRHGRLDPCISLDREVFWRATRTPAGPATMALRVNGNQLAVSAWGDGHTWAIDHALELVGEHQLDAEFSTDHPVVAELHRTITGLRVPRSNNVFEAMLPSILEQRVTGLEAKTAYRGIVRWLGEPAPRVDGGPTLLLPPVAEQLAETPAWALHRFGVEAKRATAIRNAARVAKRLEEALQLNMADAHARLRAVHGVGIWTAAEVAYVALGDADAVSVGDFHLSNWVSWVLAKQARGDDANMLRLLEPFSGQRGRVTKLIEQSGIFPPKFGPRYKPIPIASY